MAAIELEQPFFESKQKNVIIVGEEEVKSLKVKSMRKQTKEQLKIFLMK